jgi:hypothetical protein
MKKIKILAYLLTIWVLLPVSQTNAQNRLPLNDWKLNNFGKGKSSEISSNGVLLRQYSAVFYEGLNTELSSVIVECKWLNPLDYVEMPIKLTLYYQDGSYENIIQKIPKGTRTEQKLIFKPQNNSGKRIVKVEIQHGSTSMEVMIYSVGIVVTGSTCCERIKSLNTDFGNLIDEMKKTGKGDIEIIKKLENLLIEYKNIN